MKYLVFLFWIPALVVLYLSIRQEIRQETHPDQRDKPRITAYSGHPH